MCVVVLHFYLLSNMKQEEIKSWISHVVLAIVAILYAIVIVSLLSGCKTQHIPCISHDSDSVRVVVKTDTFWRATHDSVRIQLPCSDTIEVAYLERWHIDTIRTKSVQHDTIAVCKMDTIFEAVEVPVPTRERNWYDRFTSAGFWILLGIDLLILLVCALRVYLKLHRV